MYYLIYRIVHVASGKEYIGHHKTKNINDGYMGSGKYLNHAIKKYGISAFHKEILFYLNSAEEMHNKEAELVNEEYLATANTYNLKKGGYGGFDFINKDKELLTIRNRNISNNRDYTSENYRKKLSEGVKKGKEGKSYPNRFPSFAGKLHTEESKKKISASMKGKCVKELNSQYGSIWVTNGVECKKIKENKIPDGWHRGRKFKI